MVEGARAPRRSLVRRPVLGSTHCPARRAPHPLRQDTRAGQGMGAPQRRTQRRAGIPHPHPRRHGHPGRSQLRFSVEKRPHAVDHRCSAFRSDPKVATKGHTDGRRRENRGGVPSLLPHSARSWSPRPLNDPDDRHQGRRFRGRHQNRARYSPGRRMVSMDRSIPSGTPGVFVDQVLE